MILLFKTCKKKRCRYIYPYHRWFWR